MVANPIPSALKYYKNVLLKLLAFWIRSTTLSNGQRLKHANFTSFDIRRLYGSYDVLQNCSVISVMRIVAKWLRLQLRDFLLSSYATSQLSTY